MQKIKGIFFDLESTLRVCEPSPAYQEQAKARMAALAGWPDPQALFQTVEGRYAAYRAWALAESREAGDFELWNKWLLPEPDGERPAPLCRELTCRYRQAQGLRRTASGGLRAVRRLYERGCRLGLISNLIGEEEIPRWLQEDGLSQYFDAVALSSVCRVRKPDPQIYRAGCGGLGLEPAECAMVTGSPSPDLAGARAAGFGACVLLVRPEAPAQDAGPGGGRPDYTVRQLPELLDLPIFQ